MSDTLHYLDTFTDLLRQAICLISQMKHEEYILALKQWQIADSMVQSLASQFDVLDNSNPDKCGRAEDDTDSVDSAKIREQIDLMVEEFPEESEKGSSWTIFNDTFLMFSDEELESIFRKAFIRSKSKNPTELKATESQLIKQQDWSNQICDISKAETPEQAVIMMSFSDNSNTYNSTSDSLSDNQSLDSTGDLTSRVNANSFETSVNITTIQQSSTNVSIPQRELKTSLSKEHSVLTSLLEQRAENVAKNSTFKTTSSTNKSQHCESPFISNGGVSSTTNRDDMNNNYSPGSNITHFSPSNDMNNFKIEIVMELDKGMANGIHSDSKYKIKIGPEHFNNLCGSDFPKRSENSSPLFLESFRASETVSSSYQIKTTNHSSTNCDSNQFVRHNNVFDKIASSDDDGIMGDVKSIVKKDIKRYQSIKEVPKKNIPNNKKHYSKSKQDRSRKHSMSKMDDDVKFTSAIPSKQYSGNKEQTGKKQERYKDKCKKKIKADHVLGEKQLDSNETHFASTQMDELKTKTLLDQNMQKVPQDTNTGNENCNITEIPEKTKEMDETDDDIVLLEEKRTNIQHVKHDTLSIDNETPIHTNNTLANNFFLISNDLSKDKQNVKYLILNNNNLFKTLNFDGANKTQTNTSMSKDNRQPNLLLINNEKNGNLYFLNKEPLKQPNNFVLNNNSVYNPCETQYFIINDTTANIQTKIADFSQNKSGTSLENTISFTNSCDNSQIVNPLPPEQIKIAMDTPVDIQDDSCERNYDNCDKSMEHVEMPLLSQEPASDDNNKDLIQNKENILVLNNHLDEEHFKFDSNDSSVQIRLDDSVYYLNEKISNELKMGGGGKCSEIPQIYFINDLETPMSVSNEFCVDANEKDATNHCTSSDQTNQMELLNYSDKCHSFSSDLNPVVNNNDINSNIAQLNDKYVLPLLKPNANDSLKDDKINLPEVKAILTSTETDKPSLKEALKIKSVSKSKLTSLRQNSSSFLKHLKSKLDKQKPVSKNQILNKAPSNYLNKNAPVVKKVKLDDMESVLTNDPVENASKILALCMKRESETQQKSLTCHICSMVFCDDNILKKHVEEHNTLGKFTCTVCKKVFNNMKTLKTHSRIHTGEKPFRCSVCGKSFSQRGILSSHLAVHAGVKPHICKQCGHAFTQKSQLRLHEMRHGNIRHFACNVCPFKFTTKSDLQRHQRSHEGVKPFRCEYCDKTFTRQIMMKEHMNRHKGVQPYSCSNCDKTFFEAQSLNKHKLTHKTSADSSCPKTAHLDPGSFKAVNGSKLFGGVG